MNSYEGRRGSHSPFVYECKFVRPITVSLGEDAAGALGRLVGRTGRGDSEFVRQATAFHAANRQAASSDVNLDLEEYHAAEHAARFDDLEGVSVWLPDRPREHRQHLPRRVPEREEVKRLTLRFLRKSAAELPFEPEIRRGVSKVVLRTVSE